jgi:hypothetical protein
MNYFIERNKTSDLGCLLFVSGLECLLDEDCVPQPGEVPDPIRWYLTPPEHEANAPDSDLLKTAEIMGKIGMLTTRDKATMSDKLGVAQKNNPFIKSKVTQSI